MADDYRDPTKVWAYSIKQPGWYVAQSVWNEEYAQHLRSLGYQVERSKDSPKVNLVAVYPAPGRSIPGNP